MTRKPNNFQVISGGLPGGFTGSSSHSTQTLLGGEVVGQRIRGASASFGGAKKTTGEHKMGDPTREEIDAKLESLEHRLETKLVRIESKLDRIFDRIDFIGQQAVDAKTAAQEASRAASGVKWNIMFAALGTIGVLFAAWAIWAQGIEMVSTLFSAQTTVIKQ